MRKLQQFLILKFNSDRLKKAGYSIDITLDEARRNSELITINNSELVRTLHKLKGVRFSQMELEYLLRHRKKIRRENSTDETRRRLESITEKIEKILFIEDLVSIEFKNKSHYLTILKKRGFYINGIRYTPFMASSAMIRKNTALFINNNLKHPLMDILENERDENAPLVEAKFGAYFSLYSSSTLPVSFPRFIVVKDKEIETVEHVDFVEYQGVDEDDIVTETDMTLTLNAWDGQGLISPKLAEIWSKELDLGYIFSGAVIRAPFLKGLVVVFDFHKFAREIAKTKTIVDIYGISRDINDYDMIISESMFKLWFAYESTEDYVEKCYSNDLGFSIAKVNLERERSHSRTSYQFLQVLNLSNSDIANLCEPTIEWLRNISGINRENMLLYATGDNGFEPRDFKKMDVAVKAVLLNPLLVNDRYIQGRFIKSIFKKKKQSFMGSLLINANYQFMIGDPYYQACHVFQTSHEPLLKRGEHYSSYWLENGVHKVAAIRSPIVHHSELGILNFKDTPETRKWYQHIKSGIIFPANGIGMDCAIHGGADFDGDLICTINNDIIIKGRIPSPPIVYESRKAEKTVVDGRNDKRQVECQLNGHNSKVGFATNISSSLYAMLSDFPVGSPEWNTISRRLKIGRVIQGEIIDGVKGLKVPPFREHWTKRKRIDPSTMTPEDVEKWKLFNKIVCNIRPAFFRFLYAHYMTRYNKEIKKYNIYSILKTNTPLIKLIRKSVLTPEEEDILQQYKRNSFFLDNESVVNKISHYMRANVGLLQKYTTKVSKEFDYRILINREHPINPYRLALMKKYLKEYKAFKRGLWRDLEGAFENMDSFIANLRKKCAQNISSNDSELANYAVQVTYGGEVSMCEFAWRMFPQGIITNIMINNSERTVTFPVETPDGDIAYLWKTYTLQEFDIESFYED